MKIKSIRNSIIACGISVALCIGLLAGTTFAWFTDKVTNSGNKIQAGNLQIGATAYDEGAGGQSVTIDELKTFTFEAEGANLKTQNDPIVSEDAWAPGNVGAKLLEVKNYGNLAAEIKLDFNISGELTEVLWYDFVAVDESGSVLGKFEERAMNTLPTYAAKLEFPLGASGEENDALRFVFVYGMDEDADNGWQGKTFTADVTILAKQANPDEAEYPTVEVDGVQVDTEINGKPVKLEKAEPDSALYTNTLDESDENYYIISDEGLDALAEMLSSSGITTFSARAAALEASFVMAADIDLSDREWTPMIIENTDLTFDGNGHSISGMNAVVTENNVGTYAGAGFIGHAESNSSVTVKNVVFDGAYVSVSNGGNNQQTYAGVVVGHNHSALTIENVAVQNSTVVCCWQTGGIVGYSNKDLTFTGCRVENTFVGGANATAGTLFGLGTIDVTVNDCVAENVKLYTDGLTWDSTQKHENRFWVGDLYNYDPTNTQNYDPNRKLTVNNSVESNIEVVSEEAVTYVSTAEQLNEAVMYKGGNIEVTADMVLNLTDNRVTKDTVIDLNGHTLTNKTSGTVIAMDGASLTVKNGTVNKPEYKGRSDFGAAKNSSLKLENLTVKSGDAIAVIGSDNEELEDGTNARIDIIECTLTSTDSNAVSTNATYNKGDYYCEINIENSKIKCDYNETYTKYKNDNCPVFLNVNGKLTMTDTTVEGQRQGVMVRGGNAVLTNCTIKTSGEYENKNQYFDSTWGGGNEVPMAALVIGNRSSGAYQYPTNVQLINCTITAENEVPAVYAYGNSVTNTAVLMYDEATQISGEIIKGGTATVNAQGVATAKELKATQSNPGSYALIDDITFSISGYGDVTEYQRGGVTLDLNGKTIKLTSSTHSLIFYAMSVQGGNLTLNGEGTIDASEAGAYALVMYGVSAGTLTINGGTYIGETSAIQLGTSSFGGAQTCYINGGFFKATGENAEKYTLNCIDALYKAGKANFIVTGGTFVNFNPADNASEGEHTNYVAEGYKVVSEQQENGDIWYTVVPENA